MVVQPSEGRTMMVLGGRKKVSVETREGDEEGKGQGASPAGRKERRSGSASAWTSTFRWP